jgi:hypothetical protein
MSGFKRPNFQERQDAAAKAKQAALEKFRAKAMDPALADRLTERMVKATARKTIKNVRAAEKAENRTREAERAQQAEREAALLAERAQLAEREVALQAEQAKAVGAQREREVEAERKTARDARYSARKSRSKRR